MFLASATEFFLLIDIQPQQTNVEPTNFSLFGGRKKDVNKFSVFGSIGNCKNKEKKI
jgi:hypothetical protein